MSIEKRTQLSVVRQPAAGRATRSPQHPFLLKQNPFQITPFCIAPVLAGETLTRMSWQARIVSDPIANRLCGWWAEQFFFYVKLSDLATGADEWIERMLLDSTFDPLTQDTLADSVTHYFDAGSGVGTGTGNIDWVGKCLYRVVDEYFRDEGETYATAGSYMSSSTIPSAKIVGKSVMDSVMPEAAYDAGNVELVVGVDDKFTMEEFDAARHTYEMLQQGGAIDMTYEDYLRMFGVRPPASIKAKDRRPELLRFARNWTYPVSAIDPNDGSAASAVTWSISESADKPRFFTEPGFIFGVQVIRPKVYFRNQSATFTQHMSKVNDWLPAVLNDDPSTSMKLIPDLQGPLGDVTDANGYYVDLKDLFLYGEQFVNFTMSDAEDDNSLALPTAGLTNVAKYYPTLAMMQTLFVSSASDDIRTDGITQLYIKSNLRETSK